MLLLALLFWGLADRWWLMTLLLYGPRWPVLVPGLALLPIAAAMDRRLVLVLAGGVLLVVGPLMGWRTGWRRLLGAPDGAPVRVATFNMRGAENPGWQEVPLRLQGLDADLILVQECVAGFMTLPHDRTGWEVRQDGNLCLMTRVPVDSVRRIDVLETREDGMSGLAVVYHLTMAGTPVALANVHLETPRRGIERVRWGGEVAGLSRNILVRDAGSGRTARWILAQAGHLLIAGDFNLPVESRIYRRHWGGCRNAFSRRGSGFGYTRILPKWSARIDHVLACSDAWRIAGARPGPDLGSDHLPMIADLVLDSPGAASWLPQP